MTVEHNHKIIIISVPRTNYLLAYSISLLDRKSELCISSFGISVTTMEEVFFKVANDDDTLLLTSKSVT